MPFTLLLYLLGSNLVFLFNGIRVLEEQASCERGYETGLCSAQHIQAPVRHGVRDFDSDQRRSILGNLYTSHLALSLLILAFFLAWYIKNAFIFLQLQPHKALSLPMVHTCGIGRCSHPRNSSLSHEFRSKQLHTRRSIRRGSECNDSQRSLV